MSFLSLLKTRFLSSLKPYSYIIALILPFTLLSGCQSEELPATKGSLVVFGTFVEIIVYDKDIASAQKAITQVEDKFRVMHKEWHAWEKGGIVSKIDQAIKEQKPIKVAQSVKDFIVKSQQLSQESQGLFDPGIGSLIGLWGFHSEEWKGPPPSEQKIKDWLKSKPSIADISFKGDVLTSSNKDVRLDFGGNAKGLAIDIALDTLEKAGVKNALVSIGGDMKVIGNKNHQAWSIGIESPTNPKTAIAQIALNSGESIVTSGTYQRYFDWKGQRYSHILDPNTGYPAESFSSVTVIHPDAITADSAATALLIAGPNNWLKIAKSMGVTQAFCIDQSGKIYQTPSMAKRIKLLQ
ncbi:FAD:protein FMN transferase [Thiomicrorhabdus sp.]|uniref:FAD:protein FMN transferase n=1 Tax=Thiomicrorhabdus sp. TaxID=2039724 RepID=UPI002AA6F41A|nr:FAD:protein FMN transferase [Thiomicrorhabdus sp.]